MSDDQTAVSDETDGAPHEHVDIHIDRGNPTIEEVAAVVAVLGGAGGGPSAPGIQERNMWGHPVSKLRYPVFSWQRVTLLERAYMRR